MTDELVLKPFFSYFGGKYRAAPHYPAPVYRTIVEPFAGSAGYALRHHRRDIVLIDASPLIAGLWKYLIEVTAEEVLGLPLVREGESVDGFRICDEAKHLIGFWLNKGSSRPMKTPSSWARSGIRPDSYWGEAIRSRIASQLEAIRHWRVVCGEYGDAPDIEATWFVDPPYHRSGKNYTHRDIDYDDLGSWCRGRRGQVIVCEQEGADWLPFSSFGEFKGTPRGDTGTSEEVIWTSGATPPEQMEMF